MSLTEIGDATLSFKLRISIDTKRRRRVALTVRSRYALAEDVVRRNMDERSIPSRAHFCDAAGSLGIDGKSEFRFGLCPVDRRIGSRADHDIRSSPVDGAKDCRGVQQIEFRASDRDDGYIMRFGNLQ